MKRRIVLAVLAMATSMSLVVGCGKTGAESGAVQETVSDESSNEASEEAEAQEQADEASEEVSEAEAEEDAAKEQAEDAEETEDDADMSDEEKAKEVADLIDSIYVQQRTDETDELCEKAKAAWDNLTDEQKELVEGENADPDYFGRDTGDASKDDPLNTDNIGENEILVVSFGTSFNDSRVEDISGVEKAIVDAYPDWSVRRAFTAQIIINHVQARDGEKIDNMEQALERAVQNGVKNLVVQPTHLMHGAEYDELKEAIDNYADKFDSVVIAEPLLGEVGSDASVINEDKKAVAEAVVEASVKSAGFESIKAAADDQTAFVFMGHGTAHTAKVTYSQMATQMKELGYDNVFIGTVEGEPEETACDKVIENVKEAGYTKVILRPLMVVAGDHANNDMAGDDEDSWKSMFEASGAFEKIDCQIEGLGRIDAVKDLYVAHTAAAISESGVEAGETAAKAESAEAIENGEYQAKFTTDSSMFKINEAYEDMGTLTVKDGEMVIHISLPSENIVNLFPGTAEDAMKDGAVLLEPTKDEVTYSDGTTETVNGFDVPVPYLDKEFDLALIGTKGKWYDHKVVVETPAK
nr:sirohydrochlorin cobaltochelatase [Butyrivibrio sp. WCE2006]